jgi:hypothetical protein
VKRVGIGVLWFFALWIGVATIGGAIVGATATGDAQSFEDGYEAGRTAGEAFGQAYGGLILLGAFLTAVVGTWQGWLPGTKPAPRLHSLPHASPGPLPGR